jgi:hypothetical protein
VANGICEPAPQTGRSPFLKAERCIACWWQVQDIYRADMSKPINTVEACVDSLCEQGCNRVNACISALQNGEDFPEVAGMSATDRRVLLQQLVEIMAVYDGSCES